MIRPPAVAGTFYPGDAAELRRMLEDLIPQGGGAESAVAVMVPHAGYIYSGGVAGEVFAAVKLPRRHFILCPNHSGLGTPFAAFLEGSWETPLGQVAVDTELASWLAERFPEIRHDPAAHRREHSLEVQLPFLQSMLGEFSLLPLAVGDARPQEVREVLERIWGGPETLIVVSTDLSHYHRYDEAREIDRSTLARIASFASDINHEEACGATVLNGFLATARAHNLSMRLLGACNSGDTAGSRDRVVGYSAFALYEGARVSLEEAGQTLLGIARGAISNALGLSAERPRTDAAPWLARPGATFVSLHRAGKLRGCIGSLTAQRGLGEDVAHNAVAAATRDPRFAPLDADAWRGCELEVSVLSRAKPIRFADEAELLAQLRPGEDGLILEHDGRRATFLPQVWESIPDKRAFLAALLEKAGLPADTRLARCGLWRYRVIKWTQPPLQ
jgi:AmmeMemoRadiSam system protein B/AmmeMemoRadiSam system protein A